MKSPEDIIERLKKTFQTPSSKDERIKVVVLCLVISTTFWFFSALNKDDYISQINYPVEIVYNEADYIAVEEVPDRIRLEVTGGGWDLMTRSFGFNMSPIRIRVNQPDVNRYVLASSLRGRLTPNLDPVVINYVLTDSINYDIQRKISRTITLAVDSARIDLNADYRFASGLSLSPSQVTLVGPEKLVNAVSDPLFINPGLTDVSSDVDESIDLPELDELIQPSQQSIQLMFDVFQMMQVDETIDVTLVNVPDSLWRAEPTQLAVSYRAPENAIDFTDSTAIRLIADFSTMNPTDSTCELSIQINQEEIESVRLSTTRVKLLHNE